MVLLKDIEDVGCSPRDLAEIAPRDCAMPSAENRGFDQVPPLISQSIKLLSPDFFLPFPKTSGRGPSSCKILADLQAVLVLNLCLPPFCGYGLHHMRWHVKKHGHEGL